MALYLGKERVKLIFNGNTYILKVVPSSSTTVNPMLMTSDGYILKDSDGLYITVKGEDE